MSIPVLMQPSYPIQIPDLSEFQNYTKDNRLTGIDYIKFKAGNPSVKAVIIKSAEGDWSGYDPKISLAQANGFLGQQIFPIPYSFWHYEVKPTDQATRFKNSFADWDYVPNQAMVDIEDSSHEAIRNPGRVLLVSEYPVWCAKAKLLMAAVRDGLDAHSQKLGFAPFWYGGEWYQGWATWLAGTSYDGTKAMDLSFISKYKLHCASYTAPWMYLCTGFTMEQTILWQWTSTPVLAKQLAGVPNPGSFDMNYWLKSDAEFDTWIGGTIPPPVPDPTPIPTPDLTIAQLNVNFQAVVVNLNELNAKLGHKIFIPIVAK